MRKKFNVFISFDIEGVSGVSSWQELKKDSVSLRNIREIGTDEVNAVVRGIRKARSDIGEILVCDSHAEGENLLIGRLARGVHLIKGSPRNYYMVEGLNEDFDILFLVGYHSMAGTKAGGMDHTYSSSVIYNLKINGKYVGETEINAAVAGAFGVPLGFVSGDDLLIKEVRKFFGRGPETVITKYGVSRFAAKCRHPVEVQEEMEIKSAKAVRKAGKLKPFTFKRLIRAEFELLNSLMGDLVEPIPGLKRVSARKVIFKCSDVLEFYRIMRLICTLCRLG